MTSSRPSWFASARKNTPSKPSSDATSTKVWLDGAFLFHDTGLVEGAFLVDHNGTPTDPDDDEFIEVDGQIGFHGRFDTEDRDFCEDIATYLGD